MVTLRRAPSGPRVVIPDPTNPWDFLDFTPQLLAPAWQEGRVWYDDSEHGLTVYDDVLNTALDLGREVRARVANWSGADLPDGCAVYVDGTQGNRPKVFPAIATGIPEGRCAGLLTHPVPDHSEGWMTIIGNVGNYDTRAFVGGELAYLSALVSGGLTPTAPSGTNITRIVGQALNSTVNGRILVGVQTPSSIATLDDVNDGSPATAGRLLVANGTHWTATATLRLEGFGSPEAVVDAPTGSVYLNLNGGENTTLWVKETSVTPSTGWVQK